LKKRKSSERSCIGERWRRYRQSSESAETEIDVAEMIHVSRNDGRHGWCKEDLSKPKALSLSRGFCVGVLARFALGDQVGLFGFRADLDFGHEVLGPLGLLGELKATNRGKNKKQIKK
jgi:hypothetical protein